jgi:hypothetical protein
MKKMIIFIAVSLFCGTVVFGQRVQQEVINIDKKDVQGFTLTFPGYTPDQIAIAMTARLEKKAGLKSSGFKGFTAYLSQPFLEIGSANYDIYTKTAYAGKKKDNTAKLYFIVTTGNMNAIKESDAINNATVFLQSFIEFARVNSIQNNILALQEQLAKENKNHDKQVAQQKKLIDKAQKMQSGIDKSKANMEKLNTEIEKGKTSL